MSGKSTSKKIRYAVVGAGWFGQSAVLPAFTNAKENSELSAIVSGDVQKRAALSSDYGVPAFSYEQYEDLLGSGSDRRRLSGQPEFHPQGPSAPPPGMTSTCYVRSRLRTRRWRPKRLSPAAIARAFFS